MRGRKSKQVSTRSVDVCNEDVVLDCCVPMLLPPVWLFFAPVTLPPPPPFPLLLSSDDVAGVEEGVAVAALLEVVSGRYKERVLPLRWLLLLLPFL
jgi:hypothetical protein